MHAARIAASSFPPLWTASADQPYWLCFLPSETGMLARSIIANLSGWRTNGRWMGSSAVRTLGDTTLKVAGGWETDGVMQDGYAFQSYDVVIIGRGPVGATLANLLGLC